MMENGELLLEWNFDKMISAATYSVRYMAKLGQITLEETKFSEDKGAQEKQEIVCLKEPEVRKVSFHDLSINIQLDIFSYLDVKTLCRISVICKYWTILAEDDVLWSRLLKSDIHKWKRISNTTYPPTYLEAHTELTPKQIYSRCYPNSLETISKSKPKSSVVDRIFQNLLNFKSVFSRRPLNVVMFGPGLESDTKSLIQKLLWDPKSPFKVTGMFPGLFEGVGSGICLQLKDGNVELNLITLYASTRAERENNTLKNGRRISKLLADGDVENGELNEQAEVSHSVKELCRTVDAFIYVVDSSTEAHQVKLGNKELHAMMNVNWTIATVPLLVMSCVATHSTSSESCAEVTEMLQMNRLSRPWMVHSVCVESMEGFIDGFMWLVYKVHSY